MVTQTIEKRRTRITQEEIDKARQELAQAPPISRPKEKEESRYKKAFWYGEVYCDSNGYASILDSDLTGIWLGKTDELIPYLKSKGIDGGNYSMVLIAAKEFQSEYEGLQQGHKPLQK